MRRSGGGGERGRGTNVSLCSLITRLTQNMALSLCSPTYGPGFESCTTIASLTISTASRIIRAEPEEEEEGQRTRVTHPSAGIPSLTTVSWLLSSLLALFFSLISITAISAVCVGSMRPWYSGAEVGSF